MFATLTDVRGLKKKEEEDGDCTPDYFSASLFASYPHETSVRTRLLGHYKKGGGGGR